MSPPAQGTDDEFGLLLELSRRLVGIAVRSLELVDDQVSLPQFRALAVLYRRGTLSAGGLADDLGLHTSSVTRLCDRLVAAGLVSRELREDNRRQVELDLTPEGRQLVDRVWSRRRENICAAVESLTDRQRTALVKALRPLLAAMRDESEESEQVWVE